MTVEFDRVTISGKNTQEVLTEDFKTNILNSYRSITYNFTLAALDAEAVNTKSYQSDARLKYIIAKSGGKGSQGMEESDSRISELKTTARQFVNTPERSQQAEAARNKITQTEGLVAEFNEKSPGRFDLFIDDLEVKGILSWAQYTGASQGLTIRFSIYEPYGMSGFIEALQVAAVSAGYKNYVSAPYLMKIEFWGYSDSKSVSDSVPVKIEKATRYFPFLFSKVGVEMSERGTKYSCEGISYGGQPFGKVINQLKQDVSISGKTVREILTNLQNTLNENIKEDNKSQPNSNENDSDEYEIIFDKDAEKISNSRISFLNTRRQVYKMPNPGDGRKADGTKVVDPPDATSYSGTPEDFRYEPSSEAKVQFHQGKNITECIEAIIVDSDYLKKILENLKDDDRYIDYFIINSYVKDKKSYNPVDNINYRKYTYEIRIYSTNIASIPMYGSTQWNISSIKNRILKEYNWIYTGKNIDILNFKLNFENLWYDAMSRVTLPNDYPIKKNGPNTETTKSVAVVRKNESGDAEFDKNNQIPLTEKRTTYFSSQDTPTQSGAITSYDTPYMIMSRQIHSALINSPVSPHPRAEMEILGDPFFLSSSVNTFDLDKARDDYPNVSEKYGSLLPNFGDVVLKVNFRNPNDINKLGLISFNNVSFGGLYKVTTIENSFKNGVFTQRLSMIRYPGQIDDSRKANAEPTSLSTVLTTQSDQGT